MNGVRMSKDKYNINKMALINMNTVTGCTIKWHNIRMVVHSPINGFIWKLLTWKQGVGNYSNVLMNPTPASYSLQSLHSQLFGTHFLILSWNVFRSVILLKYSGSMVSHTTGPNHLKDNFPMYSLLAFGIKNVFVLLGSATTGVGPQNVGQISVQHYWTQNLSNDLFSVSIWN